MKSLLMRTGSMPVIQNRLISCGKKNITSIFRQNSVEMRSKIGDYYRDMLKSEPNNSLLLMNYGKFLYEVEKDVEKAEEYYGRAILENPCDGEVLSMYGKLIWETHKDEERAQGYFDQAINASPHDCMVLGSYANFMWEVEDDQDEDEEEEDRIIASPVCL